MLKFLGNVGEFFNSLSEVSLIKFSETEKLLYDNTSAAMPLK